MSAPRLFRVIVPVGDLEAAARFYSNVLGDPGRVRAQPGSVIHRAIETQPWTLFTAGLL